MNVSVGIVTYNNQDEIGDLLNLLGKEFPVFVVDNNSSDNTVQLIKEKYPHVNLTVNAKNCGFGYAHNMIIRKVESDYHFMINPDIRVKPEEIERMVFFMEDNSDIAVMCPKVLNSDGTEQFVPKKNPSLKRILSRGLESKFDKYRVIRDEYLLRGVSVTEPVDVEFCTGCFMACRTEALKKVGGFDERYFLYMEDADLTRELRKVGRAVYNPNVCVTHLWKRDSAKKLSALFTHLNSYFKYAKKWINI